jgi:Tol biopolymer transport system component
MNTDGTKFRLVTKNVNGINDRDASLSPDGKKIVFRRLVLDKNHSESGGDIYIVNADGSGLKQLSNHTANETFPKFRLTAKVLFLSAKQLPALIVLTAASLFQ